MAIQIRGVAILALYAAGSCGRIAYDGASVAPPRNPVAVDAAGGLDATALGSPDALEPIDTSTGDKSPDAAAEVTDSAGVPSRTVGTPSCVLRYPAAIFCDDFEDGLPPGGSEYNSFATNGDDVSISTVQVHGGKRALRSAVSTAGQAAGRAGIWRAINPPITNGALHARAFFYFPAGFAVSGWMVSIQLSGASGKISFDMVSQDTIQLAIDTASLYPQTAINLFPRGRWFCAEIAIVVAPKSGSGTSQLFIDGAKVLEAPIGTNTLPGGGYDGLSVGAVHVKGLSGSAEIFTDDVVLSTSPIGCL